MLIWRNQVRDGDELEFSACSFSSGMVRTIVREYKETDMMR